jgi:hypothetical protein
VTEQSTLRIGRELDRRYPHAPASSEERERNLYGLAAALLDMGFTIARIREMAADDGLGAGIWTSAAGAMDELVLKHPTVTARAASTRPESAQPRWKSGAHRQDPAIDAA